MIFVGKFVSALVIVVFGQSDIDWTLDFDDRFATTSFFLGEAVSGFRHRLYANVIDDFGVYSMFYHYVYLFDKDVSHKKVFV